jgi:hypothetical protein
LEQNISSGGTETGKGSLRSGKRSPNGQKFDSSLEELESRELPSEREREKNRSFNDSWKSFPYVDQRRPFETIS